MRMRAFRILLPVILLAAAAAGVPSPAASQEDDASLSSPFSTATTPSLTSTQVLVLQEAVRKGELTPEAREIVRNNPDLIRYLPSNLREEVEAEKAMREGTDNTALLKMKLKKEGEEKQKETDKEKQAEKEKKEKEKKRLERAYDWKKSPYVSRLFLPRLEKEETERLIHFGHDLFDPREDPAVAADAFPVPDDYIVGQGDEIVVRLWGRMEGSHKMKVDRDGKIFFPKMGPVYVAGKSFGEVKSLLRARVGSTAEVRSDISLGQIKGFQVSLVGEVGIPGRYQISPYNTLVQAITMAGGIRDIGSLRRLEVKRGKETVREVDLYDFLLRGDTTHDMLLRAGDAIFIPVSGPLVAVVGEVRREAIYELKGEKTIGDVLAMAGGLAPSAYKRRVQVERLDENRARTVVDLNLEGDSSSTSAFSLQDGDLLRVLAVLPEDENAVKVEGNVQRPGKYQWKKGLTVGSMIPDEKFFLPMTYLEYALITRIVGPEKRREAIPVNLRRIVVEKDAAADVPLEPEDVLTVYRDSAFREEKTAMVGGEVRDPGEFEILPGMRVSDLVKLAGDLTRNASLKEAELSRKDENQEVKIHRIDLGKALAGDKEQDLLLADQDYLLVRPLSDLKDVQYVTVAGEVRFPGVYAARSGERLSSILRRAGGFTADASLKGAVFTRVSVQKRQQELIDRTVEQLEQEISRTAGREGSTALDAEELAAQKQVFEARKALLAKLRQVRAQGRVIIRLEEIDRFEGSESDLRVEQGDKLEVPKSTSIVNVVGRVYNPTGIVFSRANETVGYYLRKVGGPTEDADREHIYMVRSDGSVVTNEQTGSGLWFYGEKGILSAKVEPGDSIVVPERLIYTRLMKDVKDITQILYQIAVTAGVLLVAF